jgi:hypothetical protein
MLLPFRLAIEDQVRLVSIHGVTTQKIAVLINTNHRKLVNYLIPTGVCASYTLQRNDYSANVTTCFQNGCKHFSTPGDAIILHCNRTGWVAYKSGSITEIDLRILELRKLSAALSLASLALF